LLKSSYRGIGMRVLALTLGFWLIPVCASAHTNETIRPAPKPSMTRTRETGRFRRKYHAVRERLRFGRGRRYTARSSSRYHSSKRYARQTAAPEISPQRAEQIQEALVEAGDLHETPTGRWDAETREAMRQYQSSNGFQPTGLPDAKSLMKLGLGPHPLPADVDPLAEAKVGASVSSPSIQQLRAAATANH
jgi:hypothetical protein